ncbi:hypothetical protein SteCoe_9602 [Stentor coeruleus]|uniref:Uncharacterized protein n=1 Tax=Stentor coeruleus TaxID=5963 RepID=A0A1R2CHK5_9CILI|nr:hypothetical protein SteCoe_9602 [Stentor coeruleus]
MTLSPTHAIRSYSPAFSLPKTHTELMETYRSWATFPSKQRNKTYKADAAGLIISWMKRILKKKLWRWRLNSNKHYERRIVFNMRKSKGPSFIDRQVYIQSEREKNYINRRIRSNNKQRIYPYTQRSGLVKQDPLFKSQIFRKSALTGSKLKLKCESAQKLAHVLNFSVNFRYMDFFVTLLKLSKIYWIGKKLSILFLFILKRNIEYFFICLKTKNPTISTFPNKTVTNKPEKSITFETSMNFSPKSKLSDNSRPINFSFSQKKEGLYSIGSESSVIEFENGKMRKNTQRSEIFDTIENSYDSKSRISKSSRDESSRLRSSILNGSFKRNIEVREKLIRLLRIANGLKKYIKSRKFKQWHTKINSIKLIRISLRNFAKILTHIALSSKYPRLLLAFKSLSKHSSHIKSLSILKSIQKSYISNHIIHLIKYSNQFSTLTTLFSISSSLYSNSLKSSFSAIKQHTKRLKSNKKAKILQTNSIRILVYLLKTYVSLNKSLGFESIYSYSRSKQKAYLQKVSSKMIFISNFLNNKKIFLQHDAFKIIKKYSVWTYYLSINIPIAENHRKKHLITKTYKQWAGLGERNRKLCRAFEMLGIFVASQKVEYFTLINLPYKISYYKTGRYEVLYNLVRKYYWKHQNLTAKAFKMWKLSKVLGIKIVKVVAILKKNLFMTMWNSWQDILLHFDNS